MLKDVLNPGGGNPVVRVLAQVSGQPSGDAAGGDGFR